MLRGLYTSAMGMNTQMQSLDVVANNLANASTTGFRGGTAVHQSFPQMLMHSINAIPGQLENDRNTVGGAGFGVTVSAIHKNFAQGTLQQTGNDLDIALSGEGFFAVESLNRSGVATEMFTRNGAFTLSEDGMLVNFNGDRVLGTNGSPITLPSGEISISTSGDISVNGNVVNTIRIVNFEDTSMLRSFGYNLFTALDEATETPFTGVVNQGYLESSNVNVVREMVNMINISRSYELNQRMVSIHDQTLGQAVSEIARR